MMTPTLVSLTTGRVSTAIEAVYVGHTTLRRSRKTNIPYFTLKFVPLADPSYHGLEAIPYYNHHILRHPRGKPTPYVVNLTLTQPALPFVLSTIAAVRHHPCIVPARRSRLYGFLAHNLDHCKGNIVTLSATPAQTFDMDEPVTPATLKNITLYRVIGPSITPTHIVKE